MTNVASLILGAIISALVSWIFYRRSRVGGQLAWSRREELLISATGQLLPESVRVLVDGRDVPRLVRSEVTIWNVGEATLFGKDMTEVDPLRISLGDGTDIVRHSIERASSPANCATTRVNGGFVSIGFDYLERRQGFRVVLVHTGTRSPVVRATFRGVPDGLRFLDDLFVHPGATSPRSAILIAIVAFTFAAVGTGALNVFFHRGLSARADVFTFVLLSLMVAVAFVFGALLLLAAYSAKRLSPSLGAETPKLDAG